MLFGVKRTPEARGSTVATAASRLLAVQWQGKAEARHSWLALKCPCSVKADGALVFDSSNALPQRETFGWGTLVHPDRGRPPEKDLPVRLSVLHRLQLS